MRNFGPHTRIAGFSLLEVLIAVVIMSVGLLAVAVLQISVVRASADSKAQTIALNLALDKLEDLTTYRTLNKTANTCSNDSTDSYQCIADSADSVTDNQGTFTVSNSGGTYTRTWTVRRYLLTTGTATWNTTDDGDPISGLPRNEFKSVLVDVSWNDAGGNAQHVTVNDAVGTLNPGDAGLTGKKPVKLTPRFAQEKIYNPGNEAGVIPIAVGNNSNSAATNPKPEVIVGNAVVETRFDVLTYAGLIGDATVTAQSRVETSMVGCTCDFAAAPASNSTTRGYRPTYWNGSQYADPEGADYVPKAGVASGVTQSDKCSVCCRDHHDPVNTVGPTFSPLAVSHPTVTTAHPHYYTANGTSWTAVDAQSNSKIYQEACRLIRVNGIFRAAPELNNDYFGLLATGNGTTADTSVPDTTSVDGSASTVGAVARYQKYVIAYLNGRFTTPTPSAGSAQATYNTVNTSGVTPTAFAATAPYVLDHPASIAILQTYTAGKWLHSRGLYIDYLEQDAVDAIAAAKADSACTVDAATLQTCILKLLPFTTINLTEIADWAGNDPTRLAVTNNDFSTSIIPTDPVRGKVTTSASSPATVTVTSSGRAHNTGLLDLSYNSISASDDTKATSNQAFSVSNGSSSSTTSITVNLELPDPYATASNTPANTPNTPAMTYYLQSASSTTYACNAPSPSNGTTAKLVGNTWYRTLPIVCQIQSPVVSSVGTVNTIGIQAKNYNYGAAATATKTTVPKLSCTGPSGQPNVLWDKTGNYNVNKCHNFAVTGATFTPAGSTGSVQTAVSDHLKAESTNINLSNLAANDAIALRFSVSTDFSKLCSDGTLAVGNSCVTQPSCTYTCTISNGSCTNNSQVFTVGASPSNCP